MLVSTVGLSAWLALGLVCGQVTKQREVDRDLLLSEMIFTENLLYERKATSRIGCASLCSKTNQCVTFTFTPVTSDDDVCRGHSVRINSSTAHEVSVGTELYAFRKEPDLLDTACTGDQDCSHPNSRCRRDKCTCTQGYYYSVSTKACLDSCSPGDLQDTYLPFPGALTVDSFGTLFGYVSREACRQACSDASDCLHIERRDSNSACWLETVNPRDKLASAWKDDILDWTYDQKNCR